MILFPKIFSMFQSVLELFHEVVLAYKGVMISHDKEGFPLVLLYM